MQRHTLYAFADGSDLDELEALLVERFDKFRLSRVWISGRAWLVNQRRGQVEVEETNDLPDWDLGLNLELPNPGAEPLNWFDDVEAIARFLAGVHGELGREFIIGIGNTETGVSEDLFLVDTTLPNIKELEEIIGTADPN